MFREGREIERGEKGERGEMGERERAFLKNQKKMEPMLPFALKCVGVGSEKQGKWRNNSRHSLQLYIQTLLDKYLRNAS